MEVCVRSWPDLLWNTIGKDPFWPYWSAPPQAKTAFVTIPTMCHLSRQKKWGTCLQRLPSKFVWAHEAWCAIWLDPWHRIRPSWTQCPSWLMMDDQGLQRKFHRRAKNHLPASCFLTLWREMSRQRWVLASQHSMGDVQCVNYIPHLSIRIVPKKIRNTCPSDEIHKAYIL